MLSLKSGEESPDPEDTFARHSHLLDSSADSLLALRGGLWESSQMPAQSSDRLSSDSPWGMSFRGTRLSRTCFHFDEWQSRGQERRLRAEDMNRCFCCRDKCLMKSMPVNGSEREKTQLSARPSDRASSGSEKVSWDRTEALERLGGDADLLGELCQIFLAESPKLLQKLREAIAEADPQAVMRAAHSLKGELGYLGAEGAVQAARELEDMGHDKNLSHAAELFTVLERELARLHRDLKDLTGGTS